MKLTIHTSIFFLISIILLLSACDREEIDIEEEEIVTIDLPGDMVRTGVDGYISTVDGVAIADAEVKLGNTVVHTDENGTFRIKDIELLSSGSLITVQKNGYYVNAKNIKAKEQIGANVKMRLSSRVRSTSFQTSVGVDYTGPQGERLKVPAGAIVDLDGNSYSGQVDLYVNWIDPTAVNGASVVPGDLRGLDVDNKFVQLATMGLLAIELETPNGEKLELDPNFNAEIEIPIPASLLATADTSIPLSYFDETVGYWIENGNAVLSGSNYKGSIDRFDFWNCSLAFSTVALSGNVNSVLGIPYSAVQVNVKSEGKLVGYGWTNEDGSFNVQVPAGENLQLEVYSNCVDEIYSQSISALSGDKVLDLITIGQGSNSQLISGIVLGCDNTPITDGYVIMQIDGASEIAYLTEQGEFFKLINICEAQVIFFTAFDSNNLEISSGPSFIIDPSGPSEVWPQILFYLCADNQNAENLLSLYVNDENEEAFISDISIQIDEVLDVIVIESGDPIDMNYIYLEIDLVELETETFTLARTFSLNYLLSSEELINYECNPCGKILVHINYDEVENFASGFFFAEMLDPGSGNINSLNGHFSGHTE